MDDTTRKRLEFSMRGPMGSRRYKRDVADLLAELDRRGKENTRLQSLVRRLTAALYSDCPASVWKGLKVEARKVLRGKGDDRE